MTFTVSSRNAPPAVACPEKILFRGTVRDLVPSHPFRCFSSLTKQRLLVLGRRIEDKIFSLFKPLTSALLHLLFYQEPGHIASKNAPKASPSLVSLFVFFLLEDQPPASVQKCHYLQTMVFQRKCCS